jgi:glycerol-3-phosphate cytidylyltransferase-like family protein
MPISLEKYGTGGFPFPKDEINPKLKDEEWGRKWCEAMYARWKQNSTAIPFSQVAEIESLRALADGRQDIRQYQKILLDESEENGDMKGYMNINWDVFSVMPKFLRVVEGMMEQTNHQVVATAVDPSSTDEREAAKLDMQYRMKFKETLDYVDKAMGIDRSGEYVPESMEELNLYEGAGGFKLAKETEIEQAVDYTFYISEWPEIKKKLIRDGCVINCMGTKDFTDQYTKKVRTRYVDPKVFIGQYSKHWDHRNMEYGGEIIQVPISDLRKLNPDIKESVLRELANQYNGIAGNSTIATLSFNEEGKNGTYDSLLVDVMDVEWMSVDSEYKTKRKSPDGTENVYTEEWGKVYDTEKKKTDKFDIKVVYKCKWIIGTDEVYDFGLQYDIPRPGKKEVELSYHLYKLPGRSLVSISEPNIHQMCLAFYKLQNAIAMASPPGIAIEFTSLQNMKLGANKLEPLDLLKIRRQTGDLLYKATTHKGIPNTPGSFKPIQELQGGIGQQLQEFLAIFQFNTEAIRELTGINQIADASAPNPEISVGGSEMALAATNNALRPIYSAYVKIKERTATNISLRVQLLIAHNKEAYKGYMPVIGTVGVQIMSAGADVVDADYSIKYECKPTEKRKEVIRQAAISAMSPDRDGVIGIELPDFLMIERLLEGGSLKYAEAFLNYKSKKNKERQQNLQKENMQLDKQREQEAIQLKDQLNRSLEQAKVESEIKVYEAKKAIDEQYAIKQHQRDMEIAGLQSSLGIVEKGAEAQLAGASV